MDSHGEETEKGLVGVDRAVSVIEAVRAAGPVTLADAARATGLSEPTTLRYLKGLSKHHIVARDPQDGTYRLGIRLREWGAAAPFEVDPRVVADEPLTRLADELGETVELVGVEDDRVVVLSARPGAHAVGKIAHVGDVETWHATSVGKAILSRSSGDFVEHILRVSPLTSFTPKTMTDLESVRANLRLTGERGYALDDEESELGLRCVGVAIQARDGRFTYAVSASGPVYRMDSERQLEVATRLAQAAREIEQGLGSSSPDGS